MYIEEDYVSFEVAKLLKEKGFDEKCSYEWGVPDIDGGYILQKWSIYNGEIRNSELINDAYAAPTHQMAMKWLREIHKINIDIKSRWKLNPYKLDYYYFVLHYKNVPSDSFIIKFDSYEEATEAAIKYTLENLI